MRMRKSVRPRMLFTAYAIESIAIDHEHARSLDGELELEARARSISIACICAADVELELEGSASASYSSRVLVHACGSRRFEQIKQRARGE